MSHLLNLFHNQRWLVARGFLPESDPTTRFHSHMDISALDEIGRDLPSLLENGVLRQRVEKMEIPPCPEYDRRIHLDLMRLYYIRLAFLASGYIHQLGAEPVKVLPKKIAIPLVNICRRLNRPPILSYDGYALYNWKRINPLRPVALGNIETIQNFVFAYDEHWFILVHIEIEAIGARILRAIKQFLEKKEDLVANLKEIADAVLDMKRVLERIPEKMSSATYDRTFRQYIKPFDGIVYEGCFDDQPQTFRGETGAQSTIMPLLDAFMKIPHAETGLTQHLLDMHNYMPSKHREILAAAEALPNFRASAPRDAYNPVLEAMAQFREVHYTWAKEYIAAHTTDPRGTGGTPYMLWLKQLIDETRSAVL